MKYIITILFIFCACRSKDKQVNKTDSIITGPNSVEKKGSIVFGDLPNIKDTLYVKLNKKTVINKLFNANIPPQSKGSTFKMATDSLDYYRIKFETSKRSDRESEMRMHFWRNRASGIQWRIYDSTIHSGKP